MREITTVRIIPSLAAASALSLSAGLASAAPPLVERRQTVPAKEVDVDAALGVARFDLGPGTTGTGAGGNFDIGIGLKQHLELGVSLGMRFGTDGKFSSADNYAKLADYRTFGADGNATFTPEVRLKSQVVDLSAFEFSLELRGGLSVGDSPPQALGEGTTRPSLRGGAPIALHVGSILRLDSGVFARVVFANQVRTGVLLPAELWIQPTSKFWVGPRTGLLISSPGGGTDVQAGLGVGYQVTSAIDLKAGFLLPAVDKTTENWGVGVGAQFRVE